MQKIPTAHRGSDRSSDPPTMASPHGASNSRWCFCTITRSLSYILRWLGNREQGSWRSVVDPCFFSCSGFACKGSFVFFSYLEGWKVCSEVVCHSPIFHCFEYFVNHSLSLSDCAFCLCSVPVIIFCDCIQEQLSDNAFFCV